MSMMSTDDLESKRLLVRRILIAAGSAASDGEWTLQGFGMLRLYLSKEWRLHVWSPDTHAIKDVSTIHTHPWDFTSYVLSKTIDNMRYTERQPPFANVCDPPFSRRMKKATIVCGSAAEIVGDVEDVVLVGGQLETYQPGDVYTQKAHEIHKSTPEPGTVTLVRRTFHADTEHAQVYWTGPEWVDAKPRPATREEIRDITQLALEKF
jgi:hypothetical protein